MNEEGGSAREGREGQEEGPSTLSRDPSWLGVGKREGPRVSTARAEKKATVAQEVAQTRGREGERRRGQGRRGRGSPTLPAPRPVDSANPPGVLPFPLLVADLALERVDPEPVDLGERLGLVEVPVEELERGAGEEGGAEDGGSATRGQGASAQSTPYQHQRAELAQGAQKVERGRERADALPHGRPPDVDAEDVGLKLHRHVAARHAAVDLHDADRLAVLAPAVARRLLLDLAVLALRDDGLVVRVVVVVVRTVGRELDVLGHGVEDGARLEARRLEEGRTSRACPSKAQRGPRSPASDDDDDDVWESARRSRGLSTRQERGSKRRTVTK